MRQNNFVSAAIERTRHLPAPIRFALTLAIVLGLHLLREAAEPLLPAGYSFLIFFFAILLSSALFDHGAGLLATFASAIIAARTGLLPNTVPGIADGGDMVVLVLFLSIGVAMVVAIESLHRALAAAQEANAALRALHADLARSEQSRGLLLREFRHRTRNDLGSLVGMLYLRARSATSAAAREGLREAAEHAMALARVHTWLALADGNDMASVDTGEFLRGLCADLDSARAGEGLRPVALIPEAEAHRLDAERAVQLGLVVNEAVTNAMKYAFPEDRPGTVRVTFRREGESFVLRVADDGIGLPVDGDVDRAPPSGLPPGSGLGTRLLRGLAAQLRGSFTRRPGDAGVGTVAELRFPAAPAG